MRGEIIGIIVPIIAAILAAVIQSIITNRKKGRLGIIPDNHELAALLDSFKQGWVKSQKARLSGGPLRLGKRMRPDIVESTWVGFGRTAGKLSANKQMGEVFDEVGRFLLIVGKEGSGKTITLLDLAQDLIKRVEDDPNQPVPLVLGLSSWPSKHKRLIDWAVSEINIKYHIAKWKSRYWLENNKLLLLLDGLDEVEENKRHTCIKAINEFIADVGPHGLVVCSRLQHYQDISMRLNLHTAVELEPLAPEQVDKYLSEAGSQLNALRQALEKDDIFRKIAETPLMLNIMRLAYE